MSLETFRDDFLNKMDGREIERETLPDGAVTNRNQVSTYGRQMIERVTTSELFQTLLYPGQRAKETINRLTVDLELQRLEDYDHKGRV